jgi:fumarylacetoacetase
MNSLPISSLTKSWFASANAPSCDFPIQNLPYGVFRRNGEAARCCVAIGDSVVDLSELEAAGLLSVSPGKSVFAEASLNPFMACGRREWSDVRARLVALLSEGGNPALRQNASLRDRVFALAAQVEMLLPFKVAGYTDFYSSRHHAFNVGTMFRGAENALPPNWLSLPIGYNGRASTVVVSGTDICRPLGQTKPDGAELPVFGPCKRLDIELELGVVIGAPSDMGKPLTVAEADDLIFGFVLLNDWSARDIQAWEYQPLGPFQSKAFATTISPWVVPKAALERFRVSTPPRQRPLLPYLTEPRPLAFDINFEVLMQSKSAAKASAISRTNARELYYSPAQLIAHHAVSGCKMEVGDLIGSGTISGEAKDSRGSLLELSWGGAQPLTLPTGETRTFIEDGDTLTLVGWAQGERFRVGFGECVGRILPAPPERDWIAAAGGARA